MDEVNADGVGAGEPVGTGAVEVGGWLWEAGKEVGIVIGRAFAVLQSIGVGGEELQPALNASIALTDLESRALCDRSKLGTWWT